MRKKNEKKKVVEGKEQESRKMERREAKRSKRRERGRMRKRKQRWREKKDKRRGRGKQQEYKGGRVRRWRKTRYSCFLGTGREMSKKCPTWRSLGDNLTGWRLQNWGH